MTSGQGCCCKAAHGRPLSSSVRSAYPSRSLLVEQSCSKKRCGSSRRTPRAVRCNRSGKVPSMTSLAPSPWTPGHYGHLSPAFRERCEVASRQVAAPTIRQRGARIFRLSRRAHRSGDELAVRQTMGADGRQSTPRRCASPPSRGSRRRRPMAGAGTFEGVGQRNAALYVAAISLTSSRTVLRMHPILPAIGREEALARGKDEVKRHKASS
jgi:hypothetical protein